MGYNILRVIAYIFSIPLLINKKFRNFYWKRIVKKPNYDMDKNKKYIMIHCSSVGEVNLSERLVKKFIKNTNYSVILSIVTDTGMEIAKEKYNKYKSVYFAYFPLDDYFRINNLFKHCNIEKLIIIETEIWPNLINIANKYSKIFLVNGRISESSFKKYKLLNGYLKKTLEKIDYYFMQTYKDMKRIKSLGAPVDKIEISGNMKLNLDFDNYSMREIKNLKRIYKLEEKKILVAGSTRPGEEKILLNAYDKLENYVLFLTPRHLERIESIEKMLLGKYNYCMFSQIENIEKEVDIVLVDKLGVLRKLYALSDVSFVGGTLVNKGGHSLLEPLYYRKTPMFGRYYQNTKEIAEEILKRGMGYLIENEEKIIEKIQEVESYQKEKKEVIDAFFKEYLQINNKIYKKIMDNS